MRLGRESGRVNMTWPCSSPDFSPRGTRNVVSMTWAGYLLGSVIPNISKYVHLVVGAVIVLSVVPIAVEVLRARRRGAAPGVSGP